jgi:hypothetical protein
LSKVTATEVASIGPITITYAFHSWVLVEAGRADGIRRRVRSKDGLASVLRDVGLPANEADSLAARLWAARPEDAGLSGVRPWEGLAASIGVSRIRLFLLGVTAVAVFGLILWLLS